jgi:hypothetical protein
MSGKAASKNAPIAEILGLQDEKISKVVDEVDRFFRSLHTDIEDWKFAMQDDGDGTRIFVRFQLHINTPGASPRATKPKVEAVTLREAPALEGASSTPVVTPSQVPGGVTAPVPEDLEEAKRADPDLASFVEEWKRKRANGPHVEFHRPGATLVEAPPEDSRRERRRSGARGASSQVGQ